MEDAKTLQPDDFNICYNLAIAHLQQGDLDNAIKNFEKTVTKEADLFAYVEK